MREKRMNVLQTSKLIRRKLTPKEKRLKNKLHIFYKKNIRGDQAPTESLRAVYENQIKTIIRLAIEDSYFTGIDTVKQSLKNREPYFFISGTDIQNIQDITEKMNNQFWTTTGKIHRRENEFIISLANHEMIRKQEFDTEAAYIGIAALMVYTAFNSSVKSKMVQVVQ